MVYFWRAVRGRRGSGAAGGGGSLGPRAFCPSDLELELASFPSSQPMSYAGTGCVGGYALAGCCLWVVGVSVEYWNGVFVLNVTN